MENLYLCKCNNCDTILLDQNSQISAEKHLVDHTKIDDMQYIKDENSQDQEYFWGCPICMTDSYLTDTITKEDLDKLL
jgi:hypothetical protein